MASADVVAIGIDLGTTYTSAAVYHFGKVEVINNDEGDKSTPSYVSFSDDEILIGKIAKSESVQQPQNAVFDVKRLIGHSIDHPDVQADIRNFPFQIVENAGKLNIKVRHKKKDAYFTPEQISGMILEKMKQLAEMLLEGKHVSSAVVTVPAYFNNAQRTATLEAGKLAGLTNVHLLNEPTAAALAYAYDKKIDGGKNILVFDFGGGTLDVSIVNVTKQKCKVEGTAGNSHLGGEDITNNLVKYLAAEYQTFSAVDLSPDKKRMHKLKLECDDMKRALSTKSSHKFHFSSIYLDTNHAVTVSRAKFDEINSRIYEEVLKPVKDALKCTTLRKQDIDKVILVGGSSKIPNIAKILSKFFDKEVLKSIDPDTAIAYGAALHAATLNGVEVFDSKDFILQDVTSMSLSVDNPDGTVTVVVPKTTPIPFRTTLERCNAEDNKNYITFKIFEGESRYQKDNHFLGEFTLHGIPPGPKYTVEFPLTYDIDHNSKLTVSSTYRVTGIRGELKIQL